MPIMFEDTCPICGAKFQNNLNPVYVKKTCGARKCITELTRRVKEENKMKKLLDEIEIPDDMTDEEVIDEYASKTIDITELVNDIDSEYNSTTHSDKVTEPIGFEELSKVFDDAKKKDDERIDGMYNASGIYRIKPV